MKVFHWRGAQRNHSKIAKRRSFLTTALVKIHSQLSTGCTLPIFFDDQIFFSVAFLFSSIEETNQYENNF
jgi:hypothetical protein